MTAKPNTDLQQAALASRTRRAVLAYIREASHPLDAAAVAAHFSVHVTTARFHLDQLESAGLLSHAVQRDGRRGRPRVTFTAPAQAPVEDALRQLTGVLIDALGHDEDGGRSRAHDAGERWSRAYLASDAPAIAGTAGATGGAHELAPLLSIFGKLGFQPQPGGADPSEIELRGCPFRAAAIAHPEVVCSAHRGLLDGTIARLGHAEGEATLHPFVEPELCVVRLHSSLAGRASAG